MPELADIEPNLSRREEMSISGAAVSGTPWAAAVVTGAVVTSGDVGLHTIGSSMNLSATSGSVALGAVAFFVVAAVGSLWRSRPSRVIWWGRRHPWRFAVLPAVVSAMIALVLSVVTGGGIAQGILSGLWHGGVVYGLTGAAWVIIRSGKSDKF